MLSPKLLATREKVPGAIGEIVTKLGLSSRCKAQLGVFYNIVNNEEFVNSLSATETNLLKHLEDLIEHVSGVTLEGRAESSRGPILRKLRLIQDRLEKMEKINDRQRSIFSNKGLKCRRYA